MVLGLRSIRSVPRRQPTTTQVFCRCLLAGGLRGYTAQVFKPVHVPRMVHSRAQLRQCLGGWGVGKTN